MKRINFGLILVSIGIIFFVCYNTYFGWNELPINESEATCDNIFNVIIVFGLVFYLLPLLSVYESYIKSWDENKKLEVHYIYTEGGCIYHTDEGDDPDNGKVKFGCVIKVLSNGKCRISYDDTTTDFSASKIEFIHYK